MSRSIISTIIATITLSAVITLPTQAETCGSQSETISSGSLMNHTTDSVSVSTASHEINHNDRNGCSVALANLKNAEQDIALTNNLTTATTRTEEGIAINNTHPPIAITVTYTLAVPPTLSVTQATTQTITHSITQTTDTTTASLSSIESTIAEARERYQKQQLSYQLTLTAPITEQINSKTISLLKATLTEDNPVISGIGIIALSQAIAAGASGESLAELSQWLGEADLGQVDQLLNTQDDQLHQAAAMLVVDPQAIREDYKSLLKQHHFAFADTLDMLNQQIATQTNGAIPKAIEHLNPNAKLVLAHVLHFAADWQHQFSPERTLDQPFTALVNHQTQTISVPTMQQELDAILYETETLTAVVLPFSGDYDLILAIPNESSMPTNSISALNQAQVWLQQNLAALRLTPKQPLFIKLPKWNITADNNLIPLLQQQGVIDIFAPERATLDKVSDQVELFVEAFDQTIKLRIDEHGGEAAAATVAVMATRSAGLTPPSPVVKFDRPFTYQLQQRSTGVIILSGHITNPNASLTPRAVTEHD